MKIIPTKGCEATAMETPVGFIYLSFSTTAGLNSRAFVPPALMAFDIFTAGIL